jgi:hypothetical protein
LAGGAIYLMPNWLKSLLDTDGFLLPNQAGWTPLMEVLIRCSCVATFLCCLLVTVLLLVFCSHPEDNGKRPIFRSRRVAMAFAAFTAWIAMSFLMTAVVFVTPVMRLWVVVQVITAVSACGILFVALPAFIRRDWLRQLEGHDYLLNRLEKMQDLQTWQQEGQQRMIAALSNLVMHLPAEVILENPPRPEEVPSRVHGGNPETE